MTMASLGSLSHFLVHRIMSTTSILSSLESMLTSFLALATLLCLAGVLYAFYRLWPTKRSKPVSKTLTTPSKKKRRKEQARRRRRASVTEPQPEDSPSTVSVPATPDERGSRERLVSLADTAVSDESSTTTSHRRTPSRHNNLSGMTVTGGRRHAESMVKDNDGLTLIPPQDSALVVSTNEDAPTKDMDDGLGLQACRSDLVSPLTSTEAPLQLSPSFFASSETSSSETTPHVVLPRSTMRKLRPPPGLAPLPELLYDTSMTNQEDEPADTPSLFVLDDDARIEREMEELGGKMVDQLLDF